MQPIIEIIAVGRELLTPHFRDTNSLYLSERFNDLGLNVSFKGIVGDNRTHLIQVLHTALDRSDWIIITGGLGPTEDDITRETAAEVLGLEMEFHPDLFSGIQKRFQKRGVEMPQINRKQAFVIKGARILHNHHGTAPGLWMTHNEKNILLFPGPPLEMKSMFEDSVWPQLESRFHGRTYRRILKVTGLSESKVDDLIHDLHPQGEDLAMTILARPGQIEIHMEGIATSEDRTGQKKLAILDESIRLRLNDWIFSSNGKELEEVIGDLLTAEGKTVAAAESCTGGLVGQRLTSIPGSSRYFLEGIVTYSNMSKIHRLDVSPSLLDKFGAVSEPVAEAMAEGIRKSAKADYGLSVTGIAGPGGGTPDKPVGLVFTAVAWKEGCRIEENMFLGNRESIRFQASQKVMDMLRREIQLME